MRAGSNHRTRPTQPIARPYGLQHLDVRWLHRRGPLGHCDGEVGKVSDDVYDGGCLCGEVRYRARGEVTNLANCHCRSCRGSSGAPFVAWGTFRVASFEIVKGDPVPHRSSKHVERRFCGRCGTALTYLHDKRPEQIDVTLATLDDAKALRPLAHIWVSHKLPWLVLGDGLPQHPEWPKT